LPRLSMISLPLILLMVAMDLDFPVTCEIQRKERAVNILNE
jgi:hypothetical protein